MTKARIPMTFPMAVMRIAETLGFPRMADAVCRQERQVRNWSEPRAASSPNIEQALALDIACLRAGGKCAPILQTYAALLEAGAGAAAMATSVHALTGDAAAVARETGDAVSAAILAARSDADPHVLRRALGEAEEAHDAIGALIRRLIFLTLGPDDVPGIFPTDTQTTGTEHGGTR